MMHARAVPARTGDWRPKVTARARLTEGKGGQMLAGCDLFQNLGHGGLWPGRRDRRGWHRYASDRPLRPMRPPRQGRVTAANVRSPETRAAELCWERQPKEPGSPKRVNSLSREPTFFIVLPGGRG